MITFALIVSGVLFVAALLTLTADILTAALRLPARIVRDRATGKAVK